jgi:hypothetical protein
VLRTRLGNVQDDVVVKCRETTVARRCTRSAVLISRLPTMRLLFMMLLVGASGVTITANWEWGGRTASTDSSNTVDLRRQRCAVPLVARAAFKSWNQRRLSRGQGPSTTNLGCGMALCTERLRHSLDCGFVSFVDVANSVMPTMP